MTRRVSPSELRNLLRQAEAKQKRAIDEYNRLARKHNSEARRAIENYNREARAYNAKVRANRQRINHELARLKQQPPRPRLVVFRTSVQALHQAFIRVEARANLTPLTSEGSRLVELSEQETANSLAVLNALSGDSSASDPEQQDSLRATSITSELSAFAPDLDNRWKGALFALSPSNPDAARHFCTSAREIFTQILDLTAPDSIVMGAFPTCDRTEDGRPTRRSKVRLLLRRKCVSEQDIEDFASQDIENLLELFRVLNDGTHGSAGRFTIEQLASVKRRVEDAIIFLVSIAR